MEEDKEVEKVQYQESYGPAGIPVLVSLPIPDPYLRIGYETGTHFMGQVQASQWSLGLQLLPLHIIVNLAPADLL